MHVAWRASQPPLYQDHGMTMVQTVGDTSLLAIGVV